MLIVRLSVWQNSEFCKMYNIFMQTHKHIQYLLNIYFVIYFT